MFLALVSGLQQAWTHVVARGYVDLLFWSSAWFRSATQEHHFGKPGKSPYQLADFSMHPQDSWILLFKRTASLKGHLVAWSRQMLNLLRIGLGPDMHADDGLLQGGHLQDVGQLHWTQSRGRVPFRRSPASWRASANFA